MALISSRTSGDRLGVRPFAVVALAVVFALISGCSGGSGETSQDQAPGNAAGSGAGDPQTTVPQAQGEGLAAFSGVEEADDLAAGWQDDAELYAIAAATPSLNAGGESPSWLYTYVSESAGSVASVTYNDADGAGLQPAQELPEEDIGYIAQNTLPDTPGLMDSTEAIERAGEVESALEESPGEAASAGLDSFSGGEPQWIFTTTSGEQRIEEKVPAVEGS